MRGPDAVAAAVSGSIQGAVMRVLADPEFDYVGDHILFGYLVDEVSVTLEGAKVWPS